MAKHTEDAWAETMQQSCARLAGVLFLWLIVNGIAAGLMFEHIGAEGNFAETAAKIAVSERLYRIALSSEVLETLSSVLLTFALYATLKKVSGLVALLAMIFGLQDSFLACVVRVSEIVRLHLYLSPQTAGPGTTPSQVLVELLRSMGLVTENVGGICFGIAALLYFFLFFQSRYIPRILSVVGLFASAIWIVLYFANLIVPIAHTALQYICFPPMAIVDIATGVWLAAFGVTRGRQARGIA